MGNFLPRLTHEAKVTPPKQSSTKCKQLGRHLCLNLPLSWFQKMKKPTNALASGSTRDSTSKPLWASEEHKESEKKKKGVVRVKVVLTKEEAAQLLAMCARGEERTALRRLERLQACRQRFSSCRRWRPALASIPEDCRDVVG